MAAPAGLGGWLAVSDPALRRPALRCPAVSRTLPRPSPQRPRPARVRCGSASRRPSRAAYLVVATVVTLAVVGGLGLLGQAASTRVPAETAVVRVGAGETLWDVAQRVSPESDPRAVVERIRQLNGTPGSAVQPGQQLRVPVGR